MAGLANKDILSWQTGIIYANALKQCASVKLKKTVSDHIIMMSSNGALSLQKIKISKWPRYQYLEVVIAILPRVTGKAWNREK